MSPWLLFIIVLTPAGPHYGVLPMATERVCMEQAAKVRKHVEMPVQTACYRLAEGV